MAEHSMTVRLPEASKRHGRRIDQTAMLYDMEGVKLTIVMLLKVDLMLPKITKDLIFLSMIILERPSRQ